LSGLTLPVSRKRRFSVLPSPYGSAAAPTGDIGTILLGGNQRLFL